MCKWMNTVIVIFLMHPVDINLTYKMGRNPWSMKLSFPILSSLLPCLFGVVIWIPTFSLYTCLFFSILYKHCRYNLFGNKITFPSRSNVWCSEGCSVNILHYTTVAGLSEVWPLTISFFHLWDTLVPENPCRCPPLPTLSMWRELLEVP